MKPYHIFLNPKNALKSVEEYKELVAGYSGIQQEVVMFVPPVFVEKVANLGVEVLGKVGVGVQGVRLSEGGGTGSTDPQFISQFGVKYGLVGHSDERRAGMTAEEVERILAAAPDTITLVVCVGEATPTSDIMETLYQELENLHRLKITKNFVIFVAYEPQWLISTNKDDMFGMIHEEVVTHCIRTIEHIRSLGFDQVLYGGSVSDFSAEELSQFNVDGFLIGSLSRKPDELAQFINSLK
ncbi:MAG TPA: triose-phosphate isomerase family protein [Candidatus Paceibacterota bacterium]